MAQDLAMFQKSLIRHVLKGAKTLRRGTVRPLAPEVKKRDEHTVSRNDIDPDALKVLYRLSRHGHIAYLVGGGVRDLLLGRRPKDFDISTDAHPRAIKKLFRNCFLIGRRFRLAHIRFGQKVIETSTFRAEPVPMDPSEDLYEERNNTFGTPDQDAHRRDFTVNGLFYDIKTFHVIDFVGGLADLDARKIRSIGDPRIRFREDPVRMLRAVRFASRLNFTIEKGTFSAIRELHAEIKKAAPPRMLEDIGKLFGFGASEAAFRLLFKTGMFADMFPELAELMADKRNDVKEMWACLAALDKRLKKEVDGPLAIKLVMLLYAPFQWEQAKRRAVGRPVDQAEIAEALIRPLAVRFSVPKRVVHDVVHMLMCQQRLDDPRRRFSKRRFVMQPTFAGAFLAYQMACECGVVKSPQTDFWLNQCQENEISPPKLLAGLVPSATRAPRGRSKGRPRRRPRGDRGRRGRRPPDAEAPKH